MSVAGSFLFKEQKVKNETPKFAHLQYSVLHELNISIAEYWYLDMVFQLSRQGWCNKRLDNIAEDMRITRRGVIKMRDRLIERGLIVKGIANRVKTTEKVNKVYFLDKNDRKSALSYEKVNKVHPKSELSTPKNNNRITKNKKAPVADLNGTGYKAAKAAAAAIRRRAHA